MPEADPYAPPTVHDIALDFPLHGFRRDGDYVVVRTGAILPKRCIRTNAPIDPEDRSKERKLRWSPKWVGLASAVPYASLILLRNWFPSFGEHIGVEMMIVMFGSVAIASKFQKTCFVTYSLGTKERRKRGRNAVLAIMIALSGSAVALFSASLGNMIAVGIIVVTAGFAGALGATLSYRRLRVIQYRDGEFWLKGCSPEFLDSLEES